MISIPGLVKKEEVKKEPAVSRVEKLSSEGKSEKEIIRIMREEGYPNEEIAKALNRAIKFKVTGATSNSPSLADSTPPIHSFETETPPEQPRDSPQFIAPQPSQPLDNNVIEMSEEEEIGLEELVQEIIDEKWKDVEGELNEIEKGFVQLQDRIQFLEDKINKMEEREEQKKKELKDMISESTSHIESIESRVGSVEKAFRELLPKLTENVRALSGIVEKMKEEKTKNKKS
ncbi:MAG: hypothetical protein J7K87_03745 [Candidatus Aenigmarchaeota archaeon]|nr:hypothetical protein [Candidatus Aenigmarchaeota archaeon]